ncbi:MAG: hypothetical protein K0R14_2054 [Burkholderiales bacterium]|jgi:hypothetical protein|nr:hypothetical protein [Burkholderiales bacterium]
MKKLLFSIMLTTAAIRIIYADDTLSYLLINDYDFSELSACSDYDGQCYHGIMGTIGIHKGFCMQYKSTNPFKRYTTYALYELIDLSQPGNIGADVHGDGNVSISLTNANQVFVGGQGTCPKMDPVPDAGIAYTVRNDTNKALTFLRVFTTEINKNQDCPGCQYWHSWHIDDYVKGDGLEPKAYTATGYTGWYDNIQPGYTKTRWYIIFSHGDDCFSTVPYGDTPLDLSNVLSYTKDDLDNQKYYMTVVSINDNDTNVFYPSGNSFPIKQQHLVHQVDPNVCKEWAPPVTPR